MGLLNGVAQQLRRDFLAPTQVAAEIEATVLIVLIAAAAWVALRLCLGFLDRALARRPLVHGPTIAPLAAGLIRAAIIFTALVLMLEAAHVNVAALLASAGVIGVVLGFGAQYLIRDVLAGFFLLSEGVLRPGDIVRLDADTGTVERVSLRVTQIRKANGELLTVPNGQIGRIGNLSRDWGAAIVRVTVPYRADLGEALEVLRAAAREWAAGHPADALSEPSVDGTVDLADLGAVVQISARVRPGRQWAAEADLRQRALAALASRDIRIDTRISATIQEGTTGR